MQKPRVVIITGLSGSGLSTALHCLQDNGFYCIDNLPIEVIWDIIGLIEAGEIKAEAGYGFGMDIRNIQFAKKFPKIKKELADRVNLDVIFIRADHKALAERFSTTRRRHPLAGVGTNPKDQIESEEALLEPVMKAADGIFDTTHLKPRDLAATLERRYASGAVPLRTLQVILMSFGFKHAPMWPVEAIHDIRFLPNPYFEPSMKTKTGLEGEVSNYVFSQDVAQETYSKILNFYLYSIPKYYDEGRHFIRLAIGCTGGRHRSVAFIERLAKDLKAHKMKNIDFTLIHRDIDL